MVQLEPSCRRCWLGLRPAETFCPNLIYFVGDAKRSRRLECRYGTRDS
jgi:hypothetical protein